MSTIISNHCPACLSHEQCTVDKVYSRDVYLHLGIEDPRILQRLDSNAPSCYNLLSCANCGLIYSEPMSAPTSTWYGTLYRELDLYPRERWEFDYVLSALKRHATLLDLGCGSGLFVQAALAREFDAYGIDFNLDSISNSPLVDSGKILVLDLVDVSPKVLGPVDCITAFHLLEHLENPSWIFEVSQKLGCSNSRLYVSVPSDKRPSRAFKEIDYLDTPPHHLTRWNAKSLESIALRYGWQLEKIIYEPMAFSDKVWNLTVRSSLYQQAMCVSRSKKLFPKLLRSTLFFPTALFKRKILNQIFGFSLLAEFSLIGSS